MQEGRWRPHITTTALICTLTVTSFALVPQSCGHDTPFLQRPEELHEVYYRYSPEDYPEENPSEPGVQSEDTDEGAEGGISEGVSRSYDGTGSYRYELEPESEWDNSESEGSVSELNLGMETEAETPETLHKFIGNCTITDYRKWYFEQFSNECKYLFNAAASHEYSDTLYSLYCDTDCGDVYSDFLSFCGKQGEWLSDFYNGLCRTNERGLPCFLFVGRYKSSHTLSQVESICLSTTMKNGCSLECKDAIESFNLMLGCCVINIYSSITPTHGPWHQLWSLCGVSTPGYCREAYSGNGGLENTAGKLALAVIAMSMFLP